MQTQSLEKGVAITSQLTVEELEQVKAQGFKTVICNCKPGESAEFSGEDAYRFKAAELGLHWVHIPVTPASIAKRMSRLLLRRCSSYLGLFWRFVGQVSVLPIFGLTQSVIPKNAIWRNYFPLLKQPVLIWKRTAKGSKIRRRRRAV